MIKNISFEIKCGEKTCAAEPGKFCTFYGTKFLGKYPACCLFPSDNTSYTLLDDVDGWVQRCPECLEQTRRKEMTPEDFCKWVDENKICPNCDGHGKTQSTDTPEFCFDCNGKGIIKK